MVREDKDFMTSFVVVLGILVGIAVIIFFIARGLMESKADDEMAISERIKPVGEVHIGAPPAPPAPVVAEASGTDSADSAAGKGKQIYEGSCAACHGSGVAGAPKLGDDAAWEERLAKGIEQVYAVAIQGKGGMPPKGGRVDLSDEDFKAAVDYLAGRTEAAEPASAESGDSSGQSEPAVEEAAAIDEAASDDAAADESAASSVSLPEFDEDSLAQGKEIYNGVCVTCHAVGVAGAPKLGHQADWEQRLANGLDAVYAAAIQGKGGMPPKGGRVDLSDEEFKKAVNYMVDSIR